MHEPLRLEVLKELAAAASPEARREALGKLVGHLEDRLLVVAEAEIPSSEPARLAVCRSRGAEPEELYVLVTQDGTVYLGRVADLGREKPVSRRLDDFDPLWHSVVSVAVTDRQRWVGERLDLWITVRRVDPTPGVQANEEIKTHHGLVGIDGKGELEILSAQDDLLLGEERRWLPVDASRLPSFLRLWCTTYAPETDPFEPLPEAQWNRIWTVHEDPSQTVEAVARAQKAVCFAVEGKVELLQGDQSPPQSSDFSVGDWVHALALAQGSDVSPRCVVAPEARLLQGFEAVDRRLVEAWRQDCHHFPVAVTFLAGEAEDWPDLLVAFQDGRLQHLRRGARRKIFEVWKDHWQSLGLGTAEQRLEAAGQEVWQIDEGLRQAALVGALESVVDEALEANPEVRRRWLGQVADFFRPSADRRVLAAGIQKLLTAVKERLTAKQEPWSLPDQEGDLLVVLIHQIYVKTARISLQDQVDEVFRTLGTLPDWESSEFEQLLRRAVVNRPKVWRDEASPETPDQRIRRCIFGLERWASAYLTADSLQLADAQNRVLAGMVGFENRVVMAEGAQLRVLGLDGRREGVLDLPGSIQASPGDFVRSMVAVPAGGMDRFVVGSASGHLHLLEVGEAGTCEELDKVQLGDGYPAALACARSPEGQVILAVACNYGRLTTLVVLEVKDGGLEELNRRPLQLPRVQALDLAVDRRGGFLLAAGSRQHSPVALYKVDDKGCFTDGKGNLRRTWFRALESGTAALRFDSADDPQYLLAGERSGFLWCADLAQFDAGEPEADLAWTYELGGAVRAIEAVVVHGRHHFLVGGDTGRLALLGAPDGRRVWKHRLRQSIRQMARLGEGEAVLVARSGGWISLFSRVDDASEAFQAVQTELDELARLPKEDRGEDWPAEKAEAVRALLALEKESRAFSEIFPPLATRESRARLVRLLSERMRAGREPADVEKILTCLNYREVALLLSYLPDTLRRWDEVLWQRLERDVFPEASAEMGDSGARAQMAALATFLQRLGRRRPERQEVRRFEPPESLLTRYPWVQREYARLLLGATCRQESSSKRSGKRGPLLADLLPCLLQLNPVMVGACAEVLRYQDPSQKEVALLARLLEAMDERGGAKAEDVETLAEVLTTQASAYDDVAVLAAAQTMIALGRVAARDKVDWRNRRVWEPERGKVLGPLRTLQAKVQAWRPKDQALSNLAKSLQQLLPAEPLPADADPLETRRNWQERLRQATVAREPLNAGESPWVQRVEFYLVELASRLKQVAEAELTFLNSLVRPRLELADVEVGEGRHLRLEVLIRPEGWRTLRDVTLKFQAAGEGGLLPAETSLEATWSFSEYSRSTTPKRLKLEGFLRLQQDSVSVKVSTEHESGERSESWQIAIPTRSLPAEVYSLSKHLPKAYREFRKEVLEAKETVVLAVLDEDLGRHALEQDWLRQTEGRRVDLDAMFEDIGPGRYYSEKPLSVETLEHAIHEAGQEAGETAALPILLSPMDQTLERLLQGEAPGVLHAWLAALRQRGRPGAGPRSLLVVSALHGARLRALGLAPIREVAAHNLLSRHTPAPALESSSPLRAELEELVRRETSLDRELASPLGELGWDLRFVLRWLVEVSRRKGNRRQLGKVSEFLSLPKTEEAVRAELRALDPMQLMVVLAGTETRAFLDLARVEVGHVAVEDHYSTTRSHARKLLQRRGEPFSSWSLQSLKSDRIPPSRVQVEGFGIEGTPESGSSLLYLIVTQKSRAEREQIFADLGRRGLGTWVGGIFRTGSPYRALIRRLYEGLAGMAPRERDGGVYEALLGGHRSPLESFSLEELCRLGGEPLRNLLPAAGKADRQSLLALGRLWRLAAEEDPLEPLSQVFRPQPVRRVANGSERWDAPLGALPHAVFGVGRRPQEEGEEPLEDSPEEYLLWLGAEEEFSFREAREAVEEAQRRYEDHRRQKLSQRRPPRLTVLGPGADRLSFDDSRKIAILNEKMICQAAWNGDLIENLWRRARAQLRLTARSPFQTSGGLPPGSRNFVGRERELEEIKARIHSANILIVGSRRMGKTSLLNQIAHWAAEQPDLEPIYLDLQGCNERGDFFRRLQDALDERTRTTGIHFPPASDSLSPLAREIGKRSRLPVFLLNEIDGLVAHDSDFVNSWRGLPDQQLARFVMVGYSVVGQLGAPTKAFFHFTEGDSFGGKAMALTALTESAASSLLDLLETSDLKLRWPNPKDKERAYALCLERSYRIPWVLQRFGQLIVEFLEIERRDELFYEDVEAVLSQHQGVVWEYINSIDYSTLGYQVPGKSSDENSTGPQGQVLRSGFLLLLFSLARQRYFLKGGAVPIRDSRLTDRSPLAAELGFTVEEAIAIVNSTLGGLLFPREKAVVEKWFMDQDLAQALRLLTLTLTLEPDRNHAGRYGFLMHIVPRELERLHGAKDPTLDALILEEAVRFTEVLLKGQGEV